MQEEQERLEAALRQIAPAAPPPQLLARLRPARMEPPLAPRAMPRPAWPWAQMAVLWRGLLYGGPAAAGLLLIWLAWQPAHHPAKRLPPGSSGIKPSAVQVGHSLLASFDAVAQLPDGTPVRFRCREWQDDVTIHDRAHGLEVTQSTPRVEVIPLRFETY